MLAGEQPIGPAGGKLTTMRVLGLGQPTLENTTDQPSPTTKTDASSTVDRLASPPIHLQVEEVTSPSASTPLSAAGEEPGERDGTSFGLRPMNQLSINITAPEPDDGLPVNFAGERFSQEPVIASAERAGRDWAITDYRWEASLLGHGPILFEQLNAERYGITYGYLQPIVSGAHFFASVPAVPYKVWAQGRERCQFTLGYYRPGSCSQPQCYRPRISADAGLFEAGVILGLIFALP